MIRSTGTYEQGEESRDESRLLIGVSCVNYTPLHFSGYFDLDRLLVHFDLNLPTPQLSTQGGVVPYAEAMSHVILDIARTELITGNFAEFGTHEYAAL